MRRQEPLSQIRTQVIRALNKLTDDLFRTYLRHLWAYSVKT
jgi:hypothetical protein